MPFLVNGTPKGIRTPAASVKGTCPRPLDDGSIRLASVFLEYEKQALLSTVFQKSFFCEKTVDAGVCALYYIFTVGILYADF